ncbi:unnamed protein product [Linum trigynum]|uniref:CCHC-type domain-containing protein n=1 Tax=Linum trigynum TaxID=586398 RepID=A0AAV2D9N2_9ROSI
METISVVTARAYEEEMDTELQQVEDPLAAEAVPESGTGKASYRDSFLRNSPPMDIPEGDELMLDESNREDGEDDPDCPTIRIKKRTNAIICNRCRRAITFRTLGKTFPFAFVHRRVQRMWDKTGGMKVGDIGNGYFQATFDSQIDHDRALYGGPWTTEDHYIAAEPWRLDFDPDFDTIDKTSVWVRLSRLPLAYFDEEIFLDIGNKLGRVEKIDYNTANRFRGIYARICVEIDLRKRLVSKYRIKRRVRRVEYEGLHIVCYECGHYGHTTENCPQRKAEADTGPNERSPANKNPGSNQEIRPEILEDFGPWMLATRPKRKGNPMKNKKGEVKGNENLPLRTDTENGSRFSVLDREVDGTNEGEEMWRR